MKTRILKEKYGDLNKEYGIIGDVTEMTYKNNEPVQVGDLVEVLNEDYYPYGRSFAHKNKIGGFDTRASGVFKKGSNNTDWKINLIKKFYDVELNEEDSYHFYVAERKPDRIITIDGKEIKLSEESFQNLKKQLCD